MTNPTTPRSTGLGRRRLLLAGGGLLGAGLVAACGASGDGSPGAAPATPAPTSPTTPAGGSLLQQVTGYVDPWHAKVEAAGYEPRTATVGDVGFSYVEGPDNGPPLVLLHAQQLDWFGYSRVLPALAASFHVFAVDYQGHGQTTTPDDYPMTANRIGADLAAFMEQVVGEPAYVSGNSSGGLLTVWLTANRPDLVRAAVLEDPPLFASEYPRIKQTIADRDFATSDLAVRQGVDDFLLFWIDQSQAFFEKNVGPGSAALLARAVTAYRAANPGTPVELGLVPDDTIRLFLRGMDHQYDPRFGSAFHRGTWNQGFDHADALRAITRPTLLLQADYSWTDGLLNGAMSKDDAQRATALIPGGTYRKVDATHVINLAAPTEFVAILEGLLPLTPPRWPRVGLTGGQSALRGFETGARAPSSVSGVRPPLVEQRAPASVVETP